MPVQNFALTRRNVAVFALGGVLAFSAIVFLLRLPERVQRGEQGQEAIEMLDAMRRPFLLIKDEETRLIETLDAENGTRRLETAVASANSLMERYQALARYNSTLSENSTVLSAIFKDWVVTERRLFDCVAGGSRIAAGAPSTTSLLCGLAPAAKGFLDTMNALGAGEEPIHADIADGRMAFRLLQASVAVLLLYLIGLVFWTQRANSRRETALLQERLLAEEKAVALEKALAEALAKVLSGFIPICASCKRVRGENDDWTAVEAYVTNKTEAQFSHGLCPECMKRLYGNLLPPRSTGQVS